MHESMAIAMYQVTFGDSKPHGDCVFNMKSLKRGRRNTLSCRKMPVHKKILSTNFPMPQFQVSVPARSMVVFFEERNSVLLSAPAGGGLGRGSSLPYPPTAIMGKRVLHVEPRRKED